MDHCIHDLKCLLRISETQINGSSVCMENLPEEMVLYIVKMLPLSDLKNAVLVCKNWYRIGREPKLWADSRISINYRNVNMVKDIFNYPWLSSVTSVKFLTWLMPQSCSDLVLREITRRGNVEELLIRGNGLADVDSKLLSSCLNRMKRVRLSMTKLLHKQMEAFYGDLQHKTSIKELVIEVPDFSKINFDVLCKCICKLKKVRMLSSKSAKRVSGDLLEWKFVMKT